MKKAKLISILVIMLSVIALGMFMGKQMFKLMEAGTTQSAGTGGENATSSVKILYSSDPIANESTVAAEPVITQPNVDSSAQPVVAAQAPVETPKADVQAGPVFDPSGPRWHAFASGNGTNVRSGPSTNDKMLFKVGKGTRGSVVEKKNGWTHVKWDFNRKSGWVRDDLLIQGPAAVMHTLMQKTDDITSIDAGKIDTATAKEILKESKVAVAIAKPAPVTETVTTFVKGQNLPEQARIEAVTFANVRSAPGTQSERVAKLPKGMVVKITDVRKEGRWQWFEISFNDGKKSGWTREDNLKF